MTAIPKPIEPPRTLGVLLAALGLFLTAGGAWLMSRGASPYFLVVGIGMAASGILLARARKVGLLIYGLTLATIILGSFLEEGIDIDKLTPRLIVPLIIAFYLSQAKVRDTLH